MSQAITLNLPDNIFQPIARVAQATQQPVEELVLTALQASLPQLEGLPDDISENLSALEMFDEQSLRSVMLDTVPAETSEQIHDLLERQQLGSLGISEQRQLDSLQRQADLVMLRKARAAVLLRFRGKPVPTAAELHQLSGQLA
ncbi:MAG: hypothetical protein SF097_13760 [Acidobacteriota bacterium]|nr:hypothetical protein [Acidobacteriota bacterium]